MDSASQRQKKAPEPSALPPPQYPQDTPMAIAASMRPITLPDGTVAYIPVGEAPAYTPPQGVYNYGYNYGYNQPPPQNGPMNTAAGGGDSEQDPSHCRRLASRAVVVSFTALALGLSIAGSVVGVFENIIGSIFMYTSFGFSIPALVLASIFMHIGRKYPQEEAADQRNRFLTPEQRRHRHLTRAVYDANITKSLFSTLLVSTVLTAIGCGFAFMGNADNYRCNYYYNYYYGYYDYACYEAYIFAISSVLDVIAAVLFLVATILTPIVKATGGSLCFPAEVEKKNGGKGCCFYCD